MFRPLNEDRDKKKFHHENGITYFSRLTERRIFFLFTLIMFGWLILEKIGIF
jgi:hypothetical protein